MVKPSLLAPFIVKMDGVSVSRFVHSLYNYSRIIELNDDVKIGQIAIPLLQGTAYNWFVV